MRNIIFDKNAIEDLEWWILNDIRIAKKLIKLIKDLSRSPFEGIGKPEPLVGNYAGCWSRRINQEHRLVYEVFDKEIRILACRYHYR